MNQDRELKIQALLDAELSGRELAELERSLQSDSEAQALLNELRMTKSMLAANEPELKVPDTREFYWSQIKRQIEAAEAAEVAVRPSLWLTWRRYFAPLAGVAVVAVLAVFSMKFYDVGLEEAPSHHVAEVENLSEHSSSLSFRSQSANMFVVWVYNKDQQQPEETDSDLPDDTVMQ
jgi:anti-sigma factor RsiW